VHFDWTKRRLRVILDHTNPHRVVKITLPWGYHEVVTALSKISLMEAIYKVADDPTLSLFGRFF